LVFTARCTSVQIFGVNLGQTGLHRSVSHWKRRRAAPVRPRAPHTVPPPWHPGRVPAEAVRLPKASRALRLPLKSAPPRGASAFADRALARDHRSVRRSLHYASAPTKEVTVLRVNSGFASTRGQEGSRPCYKAVPALLLPPRALVLHGQHPDELLPPSRPPQNVARKPSHNP
jgi:hypothetical protein